MKEKNIKKVLGNGDQLPALNSKTQSDMMLSSLPPGPSISGSVSLALADLDKMRADHAALRAFSEELLLHRNEVRVTIAEKQQYQRMEPGNRYSSSYYVADSRYVEVGVEYRNLTEVQNIIEQQITEKFRKQVETLTEQKEELGKALATTNSRNADRITELQVKHSKEISELKIDAKDLTRLRTLRVQLESCEAELSKLKVKLTSAEQKVRRVEEDFAHYKASTSWWYRFFH